MPKREEFRLIEVELNGVRTQYREFPDKDMRDGYVLQVSHTNGKHWGKTIYYSMSHIMNYVRGFNGKILQDRMLTLDDFTYKPEEPEHVTPAS